MSMDNFIQTLSDEQRAALLKALTGDDFKPEVPDKPAHPPAADSDRWLHEEPISKAVDGDFAMNKNIKPRRSIVQAGKNTWVDEGDCRGKEVETPDIKPTPRTRKPPTKKDVSCHVCGKKFKVNPSLIFGEFYRCDRCTGG